ncbi:ankyrin [Coprinopsis marcescibilis]|uniref:Ankyrin n=1 Tax=Coprinopsis marcescibilis TaxID=230819 RepID=A0A5C3KBK5_COPMA|nr:ankyrin [Coprinopsis marcescibilis]
MEWLSKLNFRNIFNENVAKRTPETGREVIDSDWFQEWLMSLLGGIVWGTGMPGAGKTVLACIVIEYLQKLVAESESNDICLLFAFCRYTERLMVIDILLAILRQLLERHPQVLPLVKPMYERHKRENTRPSEAEVVDLLRQIATSGLFKQTFYILDGLDEAASDIQVDLLEILSSLPVHFFITSRPLDSLKDIVPHARFLTIIASDPDIALLIDQKIHRMPALRRLLMNSATLKAEVVSMISSKSSGMFLLASLHLDMLKGCASESDVRKALDGLPRGLDGMYDETMERIKALPGPQADLAKRVLIWVTYAQEPLSAEELVLAVSVCPETFRFDDKLEPAGIDSLLSLCCGLIQVEAVTDRKDGIVRFVRKLSIFGDLGLGTDRFEDYKQHYPDDPHALIAATCISFLRHYGFHDAIWDRFASLRREKTSMATYPYEYWALAFLDDCRQYPSFENMHELAWGVYDQDGQGLEWLNSIHVAAAHGICEYFDRIQAYNTAWAGSKDVVAFMMGRWGETALYAAVDNHHAGVVKVILSRRGVDVNRSITTWPRDTPLACASRTEGIDVNAGGHHDIGIDVRGAIDEALDREISLDEKGAFNSLAVRTGDDGCTALAHSLRNSFALLQIPGIDINSADNYGTTILMLALLIETISRLANTSDINAKDAEGRTALVHAVSRGSVEVLEMLVAVEGIDHNCAAKKLLLELEGININSRDKQGRTALAHAISNNTISADYTTSEGSTYLSLAAQSVLQLAQFDVNARDIYALLEIEGVDIHCVDEQGTTLLMSAAGSREVEMVSRFLGLGLGNGQTALAHAVNGIDHNCVDSTGFTGIIDFRDDEGLTAMAYAVSSHRGYTIFKTLLNGLTFLMLAADSVLQLAQFDVNARDIHVEALLEVEGVDVHCVDEWGTTLLIYATIANRLLRLGLGANINAMDTEGRTALFYAAENYDSRDIVCALLEIDGIDVSVQDVKGRTALMVAVEKGYEQTADILRRAGG